MPGDLASNKENENGSQTKAEAPAKMLAEKRCPVTVLFLMTAVMFVLNVVQLRLLHKLVGSLWLTLFPALLFGMFMVAFAVFCFRPYLVKKKSTSEEGPKKRLISFSDDRNESLSRLSIFTTLVLCVILCEFVYINNFAVPDFKTVIWSTNFRLAEQFLVPAVVLFRGANVEDTANLVDSNNSYIPCQPVIGDNQCGGFRNWRTFPLGGQSDGQAEYVSYDPNSSDDNFILDPRRFVSLYYQYDYDSNYTNDPHLGFAAFDPQFIDDFQQAYECGLIIIQRFPAIPKVDISVELISIHDRAKVAPSNSDNKLCRDFHNNHPSYTTYRSVSSPLHQTDLTNGTSLEDCDRRNGPVEPCWGNIKVWPWSMTNTTHTSSRKYRFKQALIDEGSIVGFVQFFVYFLTIWNR